MKNLKIRFVVHNYLIQMIFYKTNQKIEVRDNLTILEKNWIKEKIMPIEIWANKEEQIWEKINKGKKIKPLEIWVMAEEDSLLSHWVTLTAEEKFSVRFFSNQNDAVLI